MLELGLAGLSLETFSLNVLRLLWLGLIQPARKVEPFYGGEVLTFQIIPLIQGEVATLPKNEISITPFGYGLLVLWVSKFPLNTYSSPVYSLPLDLLLSLLENCQKSEKRKQGEVTS